MAFLMKRLVCLLTVLAVISVPVFAVEAVSIGYSVADAKVRPGSQTNIQLTLSNPSAAETPYYITLFISGGPYLTVSPSTMDIASLGIGASQLTNINVRVSPDAVSTTSYVTVKATYTVSGNARDTSVTIPIKIRRDPVLQIENVSYSKQPEPGIATVLTFYLSNTGDGPAKDLRVSLNQSSTLASTGSGGEVFITSLDPAGRKRLEFPIAISPSAEPGLYPLPVFLHYYDETKSDQTAATKYIGMTLSGKANFIVTLDSTKDFYFGRKGTATISIANAGNSPADFLVVRTSSPYGTKETYVGNLDSDETETIDVIQDLPAMAGPYKLEVELDWKDKFGTVYTESKEIELVPTGAPVEIGAGTVTIILVAAGVAFWKRKTLVPFILSKLKMFKM
jgi:hypothetical protein